MPALPPPLVLLLALPAWAAEASAAEAWRFEASRPAATAGPSLLLAPRARIEVVAGHAALTPGPAGPGPAALLVRPDVPRPAEVAGTPLELGAGPWSVEARVWLRPDAGPDEGVLLALGPADAEPVLRLSVLPAEEAVLVAALGPADDRGVQPPGRTREFADPGGPPHQRFREWTVLLTPAGRLPRGRWFQLACRHDGAGTLRLAVDGRDVAAAAARLADPPRGAGLQLALGGDHRGGRPWPGAIAEVAIRPPGPSR
ncbi:MAG: LamG domain-containing protein [Verrucomicrobia bacterium]|nr:LamG domain-containing protein [Verrucomicrobiota bacterium]